MQMETWGWGGGVGALLYVPDLIFAQDSTVAPEPTIHTVCLKKVTALVYAPRRVDYPRFWIVTGSEIPETIRSATSKAVPSQNARCKENIWWCYWTTWVAQACRAPDKCSEG